MDGNLAIYQGQHLLWHTNTSGKIVSNSGLQFQIDGTLLISDANDGSSIWHLSTGDTAQSLNIHDDCNLVLYDNTGSVIWATNTSRTYRIIATIL